MQAELEEHLSGKEQPNRKNGASSKTVKSPAGSFELKTPRDRAGTFEPQLVKKHQTHLTDELERKIIALFSLGTSYQDIRMHIEDLYGIHVSNGTINAVTDKLLPELLRLYLSESEGAHHWLSVLTDLHNRSVQDILIACVDDLKGFPEAIESIYPRTEVQHCIIHQIRNSMKYVASKNQKAFMADLKCVYKAVTLSAAESALHDQRR